MDISGEVSHRYEETVTRTSIFLPMYSKVNPKIKKRSRVLVSHYASIEFRFQYDADMDFIIQKQDINKM